MGGVYGGGQNSNPPSQNPASAPAFHNTSENSVISDARPSAYVSIFFFAGDFRISADLLKYFNFLA